MDSENLYIRQLTTEVFERIRSEIGHDVEPKDLVRAIGGDRSQWGRILKGAEAKGMYLAKLKLIKKYGSKKARFLWRDAIVFNSGSITRRGSFAPNISDAQAESFLKWDDRVQAKIYPRGIGKQSGIFTIARHKDLSRVGFCRNKQQIETKRYVDIYVKDISTLLEKEEDSRKVTVRMRNLNDGSVFERVFNKEDIDF
jgi:hypothetical protein